MHLLLCKVTFNKNYTKDATYILREVMQMFLTYVVVWWSAVLVEVCRSSAQFVDTSEPG